MEKINAMGEACPIPVIRTKKALKEHDEVEVLVDNEVATQNLSKMAKQLHYQALVKQLGPKQYQVIISKKDAPVTVEEAEMLTGEELSGQYTVVISTNTMGQGDAELGKILLKGFIYALTEQDVLPQRVIFYNGGVLLNTPDSESLEDLKNLAKAGVELLSCGLCADYLGVKDQIAVGEITNMYRIVELLRTSRVVRP